MLVSHDGLFSYVASSSQYRLTACNGGMISTTNLKGCVKEQPWTNLMQHIYIHIYIYIYIYIYTSICIESLKKNVKFQYSMSTEIRTRHPQNRKTQARSVIATANSTVIFLRKHQGTAFLLIHQGTGSTGFSPRTYIVSDNTQTASCTS
jgi:hypothetical protein